MTTDQIRIQSLPQEAYLWLKAKYQAADSLNAGAYASFIAPHCKLSFGNGPQVQGKDEVIEGIMAFWRSIRGMSHHFVNTFGDEANMVLEAHVEYTRTDGTQALIPAATIIERLPDGTADNIRIFIDLAPLAGHTV